MNSFVFLFEATAVAFGLLLGFAFLRRIMRSPHPPAFLNSTIGGFAISLLFTVCFMMSLMFLGFSLFPFTGSVTLAGILAIAMHVLFWIGVRMIVPLQPQPAVVGPEDVDINGDGLATH